MYDVMPALTHAPLPEVRDIFGAMLQLPLPEDYLAAPWMRAGDEVAWFSRSAWALQAIAKWSKAISGQSRISVWIPDFFCNTSLEPLRKLDGLNLLFYPVTEKLEPNYPACRRIAETNHVDLFVLVHYWGQPADADKASEFCKSVGARLVEDAAHVLKPVPGVGEAGDFTFYSPHKHLPIPDGAILVLGDRHYCQSVKMKERELFRDICRSIVDAPKFSHLPAIFWMFKRTLQCLGVRSQHGRSPTFWPAENETISTMIHPKMSILAKRLLGGLINSLDTVAHLRKRNRELWTTELAKSAISDAVTRSDTADYTPYLAGFSCPGVSETEKVFLQWRGFGLPVTTWPDLPPEVVAQPAHHSIAHQLRKTRIYMPVHQSLTPNRITACVKRLEEYANG